MGEWPEDWFRDGRPADGGSAAADGGAANADKTVSAPSPQHPGGQYSARGQYRAGEYGGGQYGGGQRQGAAAPPGGWPDQPPLSSASGGSAGAGGAGGAGGNYDSWSGYGPGSSHRTANYGAADYGAGNRGAGNRGAGNTLGAGGGGRAGGGVGAPATFPARRGGPSLPGGPRWRVWLRPRRIFGVLALVIALLLAATVGTYFYLNSKLHRGNILVDYPGRPLPGSGTNWLIAGSDSRQGLTRAQERAYSTGRLDATGYGRSDTILILHIPAGGGKPVLISIPRDSYVNIPGHGMDKINAAFSIGGPALLAKTIQSDTGLYINHFMDIGFGGFVNVVNDIGGVRMCVTHALNDSASGVHLTKGCQILSGGEALAYVRDRHSFATQDLQREQDQRIFLKALLSKMTSTGVMLNPFAVLPAASGAAGNLTVDQGTSLYQLVKVAMALRNPLTTTVPIANSNYSTWAGDSVLWDRGQAKTLFNDLQAGQAVPGSLITGSKNGG
jgi:LCP family protein required for cell wall assembly